MRRTVYIPDELDKELENYLEENEDETFSNIVQRAVEKVVDRNKIQALLDLAGIVKEAPGVDPSDPRKEDSILDSDYPQSTE